MLPHRTDDSVSEAVSEKGKRKGRPPAFSDEFMAWLEMTHPELKTRRSLLNRAHAIHAIRVLQGKPGLRKIAPARDEIMERRADYWSWELLTELGRYTDDVLMQDVARLICETPGISRAAAVATAQWNRPGRKYA